MKTMKIKVRIWDFVDVDALNDFFDSKVKKGMASDIRYTFDKISKSGEATITCRYELEDF